MSDNPSTSNVEKLRTLAPEFQRHGVVRSWVFGSRATGRNTAGSDWDVLVEFEHAPSFDQFMGLRCCLEDALGGSVDLLSRSACKPRFLNAIEPELVNVT
jgi:hypothetical protein